MTEQRRLVAAGDLERELTALAGSLEFPPTPDLARAVALRIEREPRRRASWWPALPVRRSLVLALAALLLLVGVAIGLALGVPGLRIVPVESLPPTPTPSPTTTSGALGSELGFTNSVSLDEAQSRARFPIRLPGAAGFTTPDAVYFETPPPDGRVELVYAARNGLPEVGGTNVGLLISQFRGSTDQDYMQKMVRSGTTLELVTVKGARAWWVGGPHILLYRPTGGDFAEARSRLAGNSLIWERDGVIYRLESSLTRDEAIRIAESIG